MEQFEYLISNLFSQQGLANSQKEIDLLIDTHRPIADDVEFSDILFWTQSYSDFLREALADDSDWPELVFRLNNRLLS